MSQFKNKLLQGDCRTLMASMPDGIVSSCITDPPYNYEFVGRDWDHEEVTRRITRSKDSSTLVKNLPYGSGLAGGVRDARWYERSRQNILDYEEWCYSWAVDLHRICKPGATVACFNSTRTVAHVQVALERAGFYARDIVVYRRSSGIPKGYNAGKQLQKKHPDLAAHWEGWHSCLLGEWEAVVVLQKRLDSNYTKTLVEHGTGLFYTSNGSGAFTSNILENIRRSDFDKVDIHCTVKPIKLMARLIEIFSPPGQKSIVFDPFAGSGTTLAAAKALGRSYLGCELVGDYVQVAEARINKIKPNDVTQDVETRKLPLSP